VLEHKRAAIRYHYIRKNTYKLTPESKQKEKDNIRLILLNNSYEDSFDKPYKDETQKHDNRKYKLAKFTYIG
jgi:CRISPR/Cas system CSM-associated protein Csm5 (group 7 of RAMP superfamily)